MMRPRTPGAWWTASLLMAALAAGIALRGFRLSEPTGWFVLALALAAIACAVVAVRSKRTP